MINNISHSKYTNDIRKSVKLPTLANMCTKGQCKLSEEEVVKKIQNLARRDAAAGRNSLRDDFRIGSELNKLYNDFVSFVSPDRAGAIQKKLAQLTGQSPSSRVKGFDLFCMLNNRRGRKHDPDIGGNYISFKDEQGREVAHYSTTNGWSFPLTKAEIARHGEFLDIWNQALNFGFGQEEPEQEAEEGIIFQARA